MRVLRKYNQCRRDCTVDLECESCKHKETHYGAYDDRNFWDNVVPRFKCSVCGETTESLGKGTKYTETKYSADEVV